MKTKLAFAALLCAHFFYSQEKEVKIDTVVIFDKKLSGQDRFHSIQKISPDQVLKNATNLSEVLRFQTPIYIKENGRGSVSSPSFRGTTAQQTAFLWNGLNINSVFLGQGDINNIGFLLADELSVKSGGGSVMYGSAAIGGSIHLNNTLTFNKGFRNQLYSEAASYGTFQNILKTSYSNDQFSVQLSAHHGISENDYHVDEVNYTNWNGKFSNGAVNLGLAYKINPQHQISWISEYYKGNQHFPIFDPGQTKSKYLSTNFRTLGLWDWTSEKFNNHLRLAFTEDEFQYFQDKNGLQSSGGTAKNFILKNDFDFDFSKQVSLNVVAELQQNKAQGYLSGIDEVSRSVFSGAALLRYQPTADFQFEAGTKKESVQKIKSPWLFSFAGKWSALPNFQTAISVSKNFRYPSFNDLYFQPGGNLDLQPETSMQYEWKNEWKNRNFSFSLTPYFMDISDMIRWLPTSEGYWKAFNTNKVQSYGVETLFTFQKKWNDHSVKASLGYAYTKSINQETRMQLMYVPYHKGNGMVEYQYKKNKIYLQALANGKTYTDSMQKEMDALQPYFILNSGIEFPWTAHVVVGAKVNNIFSEVYATTAYYYMPTRNFSATLKLNF
ncbi:TonB-dependent receptor plug domain-containing protein [Amniculibacterium sp. G2-70]|uniref:TonB-dependent receptor plug domain-containing protein n=1 Tax=Amniculibacterium sp. G2-70 TaxID=2767188 RepID=UPI0016549347|nr:TonB-dependent receptor [Amniculibacterium sp. G2-70]